jgi:hypothetical protein
MCIEVYQAVYYFIQSFIICTLASSALPLYVLQPTHNCPHQHMYQYQVTMEV